MGETSSKGADSPGSLRQWWIAHPFVGFIGTVASLISLPLAFYLYLAGQPTRDLRITSDPPVAIVKTGQEGLEVIYHGEKVLTNVYARKIYTWNAGNDSIRRENVLDPICLSIGNGRLLGVGVKKVSRRLTKFGLTTHPVNRCLIMSWDILEHNDGAAIEVVYAASDAGVLGVTGAVEHQKQIVVHEYQASRDTSVTGWRRLLVYSLLGLLGMVVVALGFVGIAGLVAPRSGQKVTRGVKIGSLVFAVIMIGGGSAAFWLLFYMISAESIPPVF